MKHDSEALLWLDTKQVTSVVSYVYECPVCEQAKRYAYPPFGWGVFCDGKEFRTQKRTDALSLRLGRAVIKMKASQKILSIVGNIVTLTLKLCKKEHGVSRELTKEDLEVLGKERRKDNIVIRLVKRIFRKQLQTPQHIYNLARHYGDVIQWLPFTVDFVILEKGDMFYYEIMTVLWSLEDDNIIERIEGARYKATTLGMVVLTQIKNGS